MSDPRAPRWLMLVPFWLVLGCASSSPFNQPFVEVVTPNFHVTSSLGDDETRTLALDLEVFHAGTLLALGLDADAPARTRTRVLAFDGRGPTRPFAVRGATSFLVPTIDGPTLVIRATGGFDERVGPDTRHAYAHRLLRDQVPVLLPLWYEEGRAQIASTVATRADQAEIGAVIPDHRTEILDWRKTGLAEIVETRQVARWSPAARREFEARAWALAHTLLFASESQSSGTSDLDRLGRAFAGASAWQMPTVDAVLRTNEAALTNRVHAHLEEETFRGNRIRVDGLEPGKLELAPVSAGEARIRLGSLALELDRPVLAAEYFERALAEAPDSAEALAGHALARARQGDFAPLDSLVGGEDLLAPRAGYASALWLGWAHLERTERASDASERATALGAARGAFQRALDSSGSTPRPAEAWAGIALGEAVYGGGGDEAYRLLEKAAALQPGALRIRLISARIAASLGRSAAASSEAGEVISRTHWLALERAARPFVKD